MKILSWNCRGLGNLRAVRALKRLIHSKDHDVVLVMETRLYSAEASRHRGIGGLQNVFPVQCAGQGRSRAGGLCLFWGNEVEVEVISASLNHILFNVVNSDDRSEMRCLGVYGFPDERKKATWDMIRRYTPSSSIPFMCFGDFNDTLSPADKLGGDPPDVERLQEVSQACVDCALHEVDFSGYRFTWSNKRKRPGTIEERLDYALVNEAWRSIWPVTSVYHLPRYRSDHNPILIFSGSRKMRKEMARANLFRFEQLWLQEGEECAEVVTETWGRLQADLPSKISQVGDALQGWGKEKFGDLPRKISDQRGLLERLQRRDQIGGGGGDN
ncbi:uncharacterized protein LOC130737357 [Lotus japonicus]|uniref:uncharacterized protein LOC130737357 n=1 Tax=Lotus japonicus TaxID=34305 RepID=UPI0025848698|nr:uncharacterized protein LOC130737357 [Lotus japonicus]